MRWFHLCAVLVLRLSFAFGPKLAKPARHPDEDRGDVPGWVMITVMTAIVVIALLVVFRDAVTSAISDAFEKVTGAG